MIPARRRSLSIALNLIGAAFISYDLIDRALRDDPPWIAAPAWLAIACWVTVTFLPEHFARRRLGLYVVMIVTGSFVACATNVLGFVPAVAGLIPFIGQVGRSWRAIGVAVAGSAALLSLGALAVGAPPSLLVTALSFLLVICVGGLSRRQYRSAEAQSRVLLEERLAVEQERALVATLTERSRIARDLHDVLAHSLGGLVIQLDAVDALLESGRTDDARKRVIAARELAVSGLDEAKRAVSTLREPADSVEAVCAELVRTHRDLGGEITVEESGEPVSLAPDARVAFRRALQELLTNTRRHAPGSPTTLRLEWTPEGLTVTASTAPGPPPAYPTQGGGHGLAGMRERVEGAGGAMIVRREPAFAVELTLPKGAS
ncbi:sensor histidine kinase [Cryptosporangium phraense]|uniref:histidine kinase n=1 Tax=Cryptosporangium phraense TaxID=2593070 RepID=A0A545AMY6_9ACTN|nr:histidine kinase [Cryptosporangium phraense]TQS42643.1 two-component sensor histidine kinase [Cryptosporangium phraense]